MRWYERCVCVRSVGIRSYGEECKICMCERCGDGVRCEQ